MLDVDSWSLVLDVVQLVAVMATLWYFAIQVRGERVAQGFQAYALINQAYMQHLWLAAEDERLNCVWQPIDPGRKRKLDRAQSAGDWGAWHLMDSDEKRCYRYTRATLEIIEQAWEVRRRNMIGADTWQKWGQWLAIWTQTRYFRYVYEDTGPRLLEGFCDEIDRAIAMGPAVAPQATSPRESG